MEKQKRWQTFLILAVVVLTFYNILPTVFYYARPLKSPVNEKSAEKVASGIVKRVNELEGSTLSWLKAQSKNLGLKPTKIFIDKENPKNAQVVFKTEKEAEFFRNTLGRAGALIPFVPAQLSPGQLAQSDTKTSVHVQRRIGLHLDPKDNSSLFNFVPKEVDGKLSQEYRALVNERASFVALTFAGESPYAQFIHNSSATFASEKEKEQLLRIARKIVEVERAFGDKSAIANRYYANFSQIDSEKIGRGALIAKLASGLDSLKTLFGTRIDQIKKERQELQNQGQFLDSNKQQLLENLESQKNIVDGAVAIVARNRSTFESGLQPLTHQQLLEKLSSSAMGPEKIQTIEIGSRNPFVSRLNIDWNHDEIEIVLHEDVAEVRNQPITNELRAIEVEKLNQLLYSEIARASQGSDESINPSLSNFVIELNQITNSSSLLTLDLRELAKLEMANVSHFLTTSWDPKTNDLLLSEYPVIAKEGTDPSSEKLGCVLYAPILEENPEAGFRNSSIYVICRNLKEISEKYKSASDEQAKAQFNQEFQNLKQSMREIGFIGYFGQGSNLPNAYKNDYVFELDDFYSYLLAATRENFSVKGDKKVAVLEFTDNEQRLLTHNKIEDQIHEDLLKWKDSYQQTRVSLNPKAKYDVPKPTTNALLSNFALSFKKYFRGDNNKILKWGLDLSGGKTVRIGLKDQNNQPITDPEDLRAAVNELYQRVNRLGLSEVAIRTENNTIAVDFPGSQGLSASELIKASAMYFHIVNEKFTPNNPELAEAVSTFLEDVWSEAVITNRTDFENLNLIAWQHLGGNPEKPEEFSPLSSHAKLLYANGLRIANPKVTPRSNTFNDQISQVVPFKGADFTDWQGQTNPLLIVFHNFALEGANLTDVQTAYDPSKGNMLHFSVSGSQVNRLGQKSNPRDQFFIWTSQFSEDKIADTPKAELSKGQGWRMAVVLNGRIVSAPTLNSALRESASITGHFTQREVNMLAADLKAGSLSFTPEILSEENVSPDLGERQRKQGILAGLIGICLVVVVMVGYYRFAGIVAVCAVLFNLLIIWAVLQNLGAALTLPGIAGIILAVGMSVDANVLVFERIREEFSISGRLPSAIMAGYRKAFTAIVDSNLTTIIAAIILLNFDSGPIKGFALTLIIGIVSSMFTSLFMTRTFFSYWVQNPKHKSLKMMNLFSNIHVNFLSKAKIAFSVALIIFALGTFAFIKDRQSIFGMDFTGGYSLTVDLQEQGAGDYKVRAEKALVEAGATANQIHIQQLNKPYQLRIQLAKQMDQAGEPFYLIGEQDPVENPLFGYETNQRIVWIVQALEAGNLVVNPSSLVDLDLYWTQVSGQLSDVMRNQAIIGLGLALLAILIYVTFRFEFKYAISATLALAHDLLVTLAILAILHLFMGGIQIDLEVIAALMTIVGYSLNDTIIIFDRIREDIKVNRKKTFREVINQALNTTLSRTIMTSTTTLVVLVALVLLGGKAIFNFSLIMFLGVLIGTFSSLFIAAPTLLYFHNKKVEKEGVVTK